jgi:5-methylcytosine-specific restriction endonuclease McrA
MIDRRWIKLPTQMLDDPKIMRLSEHDFITLIKSWFNDPARVNVDPDPREEYKKYLDSPSWKQTRKKVLRHAGYRCEICGANSGLDVHHKTYEHVGYERQEELQVLCSSCHTAAHHRKADNGI